MESTGDQSTITETHSIEPETPVQTELSITADKSPLAISHAEENQPEESIEKRCQSDQGLTEPKSSSDKRETNVDRNLEDNMLADINLSKAKRATSQKPSVRNTKVHEIIRKKNTIPPVPKAIHRRRSESDGIGATRNASIIKKEVVEKEEQENDDVFVAPLPTDRKIEITRNIAKLIRPIHKSTSASSLSSDKTGPITPDSPRTPPRQSYFRSKSLMVTRLNTVLENLATSRIPLVRNPDGTIGAIKKPIGELLPKHTPEERAELATKPAPHDRHFKKRTQSMGLLPLPILKKEEKEPEIIHHETAEGMTLVLAVPVHNDTQSVAKAAPTKRGKDSYETAPYGETYILSARCKTTGIDRYIKFVV